MRAEQLEAIRVRRAAKEAEQKKKAEEAKAAKAAAPAPPKKDKHIMVEDLTVPPRQQPPKRGRNSSSSPVSLESIPEVAEGGEPAKRARSEPTVPSQPLTLSRPTSSRTFTVNSSEEFRMAMDHIVSLANAAKGFVKVIEDVESRNVALELDLNQKNKLIAEGEAKLLRLQSAVSDLEEARTSSVKVIENLRASEKKLKADLEAARNDAVKARQDAEVARKEAEDARNAAKLKEEEFAEVKEELEFEVLGGVEDGYEKCLNHIRAVVPDLDLSEFAWNSLVVDGKIKRKPSSP